MPRSANAAALTKEEVGPHDLLRVGDGRELEPLRGAVGLRRVPVHLGPDEVVEGVPPLHGAARGVVRLREAGGRARGRGPPSRQEEDEDDDEGRF